MTTNPAVYFARAARAHDRRARLLALAFPAQRRFIDDRSRLKAAQCTRRAGKTGAVGIDLFLHADARPGTTCLYLALTRESAKRLLWRWLKKINKEAKYGLHPRAFNEAALSVTFPNGSIIYLLGADAKDDERDKLLGQAYAYVAIDEAAAFRIDLRRLVFTTLKPATADQRGTIVMISTPGDFMGSVDEPHLFYAATTNHPTAPGWSVHKWTAFDNPHMTDDHQWQDEIDEIEARDPLYKLTAAYQNEYLGQWAIDPSKLVYRYDAAANGITEAPTDLDRFGLGIDLGFRWSAFTLTGYRRHDPRLYVLRSWKLPNLDLSSVAAEIGKVRAKHSGVKLIVDGAARQSVEEMRKRHKLPLETADKVGKPDFIRLMNADFVTRKILVVASECGDLLDEWSALIWDEKADVRKELEGCANHCADATLYNWRYARNYLVTPKAPPKETDVDKLEELAIAAEDRRLRQELRERGYDPEGR